jgi:inosose dehydratase
MSNTVNRREFTKTLAAGLGAAALPAALPDFAEAQSRKLPIGITALIFAAVPRTPENFAQALADSSKLGYHKIETFAQIVYDLDQKGTLGDLLAQHKIPLVSAYATMQLVDTSTRKEDMAKLIGWGKALARHGGKFMVLAPNSRPKEGFNFNDHKKTMADSLTEYAKAMNDIGLGAGLHQHTNTVIDSRDETYAVMELVDTKFMKFAPDVGQLQKGGADAAQVIKDFKNITVHMHLKDFKGWEHFAGYCPLGEGKVDLKSILDTMEAANPAANIMHELDGSRNAPYTPFETAQISRTYLEKLGYKFRATS